MYLKNCNTLVVACRVNLLPNDKTASIDELLTSFSPLPSHPWSCQWSYEDPPPPLSL